MSTETDTEKLQRALKQKQFYEKALNKLDSFKSELNKMQEEYEKLM